MTLDKPSETSTDKSQKAKPTPGETDETLGGFPLEQRRRIKKLRQRALKAENALAELEVQFSETPSYPMARRARMRRRHWGLLASFVGLVLAPLLFTIFYLSFVARDQYVSTAGFAVRSQDKNVAADVLGGLASFTGSSTASNSDILYEFIQSQEIVQAVNVEVDLRSHFSQHWPQDWAFSLWPDATLEELVRFWRRIVSIAYDSGSGLTEIHVVAFDPDVAREITRTIIEKSQTRLNALNEQARADAMGYAEADLAEAENRLKEARQALAAFRSRTRIVDPGADIQGRMGVMNNLQQQLAEALIDYDLLRGTVQDEDVRLKTARQRIDVIRDRIDIERQTFASSTTETGAVGEDYPSLISEFERLSVDQEFAEQSYRAALAGLEVTRDEASRQSLYLATYIKPTRAEEAQQPRRFILSALIGVFLLLIWSVLVLIYYSIRDRS